MRKVFRADVHHDAGLKLADDIELALYADEVVIRLFRRIEIGDVYANIKGGKFEMTFSAIVS